MTEPTSPPLLAYADLPARHGIQYEIRPDGATFQLPPTPWWRRGDVLPLLAPLLLLAIPLVESALHAKVAATLFYFAVCTVTIVSASIIAHRRRRTGVIEITSDSFRIDNMLPLLSPDPQRATPALRFARTDVYSVNFVEHSGRLVIHIHGHEMIEFKPSRDPHVSRWLAQELRRGLGLSK